MKLSPIFNANYNNLAIAFFILSTSVFFFHAVVFSDAILLMFLEYYKFLVNCNEVKALCVLSS